MPGKLPVNYDAIAQAHVHLRQVGSFAVSTLMFYDVATSRFGVISPFGQVDWYRSPRDAVHRLETAWQGFEPAGAAEIIKRVAMLEARQSPRRYSLAWFRYFCHRLLQQVRQLFGRE